MSPAVPSSALRATLTSRPARGAALAAFLSGVATSAAAPQIGLFLVTELHASLPAAGLYYLTSLTAPIVGFLVGARSDSTGNRVRPFQLCVLVGTVAYLGIAAATQAWMPFVINAVGLGFAAAAVSQLFAALHDQLVGVPARQADSIVNVVRMALTAGWVIGPAIGSWLATQVGFRATFIAVAVCTAAQVVPVRAMRRTHASSRADGREPSDEPSSTRPGWPAEPRVKLPPEPPAPPAPPGRRRSLRGSMWPLLTFTGLFVLVYAGEPIKYGFLPIYLRDQLHLDGALIGAVIGIQPLVELLIMPFSIVLARRVGAIRLMAGAAVCGAAANACFAWTGTVAGMFVGQGLMGVVWGIFASLGILTAQRLLPDAIATASGIFLTAPALSTAVGGAVGAAGVAAVGLPLVFLFPGLLALSAAAGLVVFRRRRHDH